MESPALRVMLLGGLSLSVGETALPPLDSARAESLLAYLVLRRDAPQPRAAVAFLLWPDSSEAQARTNLRHVLHTLRRGLPDADRFLDVTPRTLRWRPDAPVWLDVAAFEDALERGAIAAAVDAYTGDLLEGSYDEWLLPERERLRERYIAALERLAADSERDDAIAYAERLLRADPLREATYRRLMRLHDERGDRARALRVYHACTAALERELGVEPSAATRAAYEALLPGAEPAGGPAAPPGLVGRARERARLSELWREAEGGRARLILVKGEAGIGKSRLVDELRSWCAHGAATTAAARCYPAEGALAYAPVVAWLREAPIALRRVRLDEGRLRELARVLPELPGTPLPLPADEQRPRLFDAIARALLGAAAPVLLVADDLQWADRETLQFLHYLVRTALDGRLLVAATVRSEAVDERLDELIAGLRALDRLEEIELEPLSRDQTAVLATRFADRPLADDEAARLFSETEGNPLFVIETMRAGAGSPRVQAVIESRLAQLSEPARDLAGVAAVVGREFTAEVLARAAKLDEDALVHALDELWRRRIVRDQGPDAYDFTHDRIREVAYGALAPAGRRRAHLGVAHALVAAGCEDPAQIAMHFDRAGGVDDAVVWYERAAAAALGRRADADAVRALERAIELVRDPGRRLHLTTALVGPLAMLDGLNSARLARAQRRTLDLAGELGVEPEPPLLRSLALSRLAAGEFDAARRYGERLFARAVRDDDDVQRVEGHYALGVAAFWSGELEEARRHFEAAIAGYRAEDRPTHLARYGLDPQIVCMSRLANTQWLLGERRAVDDTRARALALAEEVGHPSTLGTTLVFAAVLALDAGDEEGVRRYAAALEDLCRRHESRVLTIAGEGFAGFVDVLDGRRQSGLARIRRAVEESAVENPAPGNHAISVRVLIEACAVAGDWRGGLAATEIPVDTRLWEPLTRRLRARFAEERSRGLSEFAAPGPVE